MVLPLPAKHLLRPLGIVATTVVLVAAVIATVSYWQPRYLADHWQAQLGDLPDDQVEDHLEKIAALGDPGISVMVAALNSQRPGVARAARQALFRQIGQWKALGPRLAGRKLNLLADNLARRAEQFGPSGRSAAADLARQVLIASDEIAAADSTQLTTACSRVLRVCVQQPRDASRELAALWPPDQQRVATHWPSTLQHNNGRTKQEHAESAAGRPSTAAPPSDAADKTPAISGLGKEPRPFALGNTSRPLPGAPSPAATDNQRPEATWPEPPVPSEPLATSRPPIGATTRPPVAVEQLSSIDLFSRMHGANAKTLWAVQKELARRGFTPRQSEVGWHLTHPDAQQRLHWAEALPGLSGVDAKPWLLWLSYDENAQVRFVAITLMATSRDPEMLRRVAEVARLDVDDDVRTQALRISGQSSGTQRR